MMTSQQILLSIVTFFSGGSLVTLIGFLVYRKRTKAETAKINAETEAKLAEAKSLEAQAAKTLSDAVSDIVEGFQSLIKQSESRCQAEIQQLKCDLVETNKKLGTIQTNYAKLKEVYDDLKTDYALLLAWAKEVSKDLKARGIPYPDPPENLKAVIPHNTERYNL